jgi:hypothetical protein
VRRWTEEERAALVEYEARIFHSAEGDIRDGESTAHAANSSHTQGWSPQLHRWIEASYPCGLPWSDLSGQTWRPVIERAQREIGLDAAAWLRRSRYERRLENIREKAEAKRWSDLGPLAQWLRSMINDAMKRVGSPCIDNERWAEFGSSSQMRRYRRRRERRGCGSCDEVITHNTTGRQFLIGFNYGH